MEAMNKDTNQGGSFNGGGYEMKNRRDYSKVEPEDHSFSDEAKLDDEGPLNEFDKEFEEALKIDGNKPKDDDIPF
jgi:hypothetical protein